MKRLSVKMKKSLAGLSAVFICLVYFAWPSSAKDAKGPKVTDKVTNKEFNFHLLREVSTSEFGLVLGSDVIGVRVPYASATSLRIG